MQTRDGMEEHKIACAHMGALILVDIQLPEISGLEVTKWLKKDDNLKQIPTVAVMAVAMKGDEGKICESGCEAYIAKSVSVTNFPETVEQFLA